METLDLPPNSFFIILAMLCSETLEPKLEELIEDVLHLNFNRDDDCQRNFQILSIMIIKGIVLSIPFAFFLNS